MNKNINRMWRTIVARFWEDETFKAKLLENPASIMKDAGIEIPSGKKIRIVATEPDEAVFILPAAPDGGTAEADDERLAERVMFF